MPRQIVYTIMVIVSLSFMSCRHGKDKNASELQVIDGKVVSTDDKSILPYTFGLIDQKYGHKVPVCTATQIGPRHLLSAARCFEGGAKDYALSQGNPARPVANIEILKISGHPDYYSNFWHFEDDLVMILTDKPLPTKKRQISVAANISQDPVEILIAGYGEHRVNPWRFGPAYIEKQENIIPLDGRLRQGLVRFSGPTFKHRYQKETFIQFEGLPTTSPILGRGDSGGAAYLKQNNKLAIVGINLEGSVIHNQAGQAATRQFGITNIAKYLELIECSFYHEEAPLPASFSSFKPDPEACASTYMMSTVDEFQEHVRGRCQGQEGWEIVYDRYCLPVTEESCAALDIKWNAVEQSCDYSELGFLPPQK